MERPFRCRRSAILVLVVMLVTVVAVLVRVAGEATAAARQRPAESFIDPEPFSESSIRAAVPDPTATLPACSLRRCV